MHSASGHSSVGWCSGICAIRSSRSVCSVSLTEPFMIFWIVFPEVLRTMKESKKKLEIWFIPSTFIGIDIKYQPDVDPFDSFPYELHIHVASFLSAKDLLNIGCVNRTNGRHVAFVMTTDPTSITRSTGLPHEKWCVWPKQSNRSPRHVKAISAKDSGLRISFVRFVNSHQERCLSLSAMWLLQVGSISLFRRRRSANLILFQTGEEKRAAPLFAMQVLH